MTERELLQKLERIKRKTWKPVTQEGDGEVTASKFSGAPCLLKNEKWPVCPNCRKPMQLFLQLNIAELPGEFKAASQMSGGLLQMFYCVSKDPPCEIDCKAYYPFSKSTLLRIINPDAEKSPSLRLADTSYFPAKIITGWEEKDDYPGATELEMLGFSISEEEEDILESLEVPVQGDKLGGWPLWVQNVEYPFCPRCRDRMGLLLKIDSEDNLPYMFGDMGCGHITQCNEHKDVLAFGWACY